jgi:hypothetical protein
MRGLRGAVVGACCALLAIGASGCGSHTSAAPQPDASPDSTNPPTTATTTPQTSLHLELTTGVGWHYAVSVNIPDSKVTFAKGISASPPGKARMTATIVGDSASTADLPVQPDNPGRPNGPQLTVSAPRAVFDLGRVANFPLDDDAGTAIACFDLGGGFALSNQWPFDDPLVCQAGSGSWTSGSDAPESTIDKEVAALNAQQPAWQVGFDGCSEWLLPSGATGEEPNCKVKVTVSR